MVAGRRQIVHRTGLDIADLQRETVRRQHCLASSRQRQPVAGDAVVARQRERRMPVAE